MNRNFWKNKKIYVTGAGGFIGSNLVRYFADNGIYVVGILSKSNKGTNNIFTNKYINYGNADLMDLDDAVNGLKGADFIFHFAGLDGGGEFKNNHQLEIFRTNSIIGLNVLEAAKLIKCKNLLLASSIEVYQSSDSKIKTEKDRLFINYANIGKSYIWGKQNLELSGIIYKKQTGMNISVIRLGNIYGPGDNNNNKTRLITNMISYAIEGKNPSVLITNDSYIPYLYVNDACKMIVLLGQNIGKFTVANVISNNKYLLSSIAEYLTEYMSTKKIRNIDSIKQKDFINIYNFINKILCFEQISMQDGLKHTFEYYINSIGG